MISLLGLDVSWQQALTVEIIPLTVTAAHVKSSLRSQTFNSAELQSVTLMPQYLNSDPSINFSAPRLTSWLAGILKLNSTELPSLSCIIYNSFAQTNYKT
jgi:hypothetical protein